MAKPHSTADRLVVDDTAGHSFFCNFQHSHLGAFLFDPGSGLNTGDCKAQWSGYVENAHCKLDISAFSSLELMNARCFHIVKPCKRSLPSLNEVFSYSNAKDGSSGSRI
jgi:hypothetical protein